MPSRCCWWCGNEADAELTRDLDRWVCTEPEACYARGRRKRGPSAAYM